MSPFSRYNNWIISRHPLLWMSKLHIVGPAGGLLFFLTLIAGLLTMPGRLFLSETIHIISFTLSIAACLVCIWWQYQTVVKLLLLPKAKVFWLYCMATYVITVLACHGLLLGLSNYYTIRYSQRTFETKLIEYFAVLHTTLEEQGSHNFKLLKETCVPRPTQTGDMVQEKGNELTYNRMHFLKRRAIFDSYKPSKYCDHKSDNFLGFRLGLTPIKDPDYSREQEYLLFSSGCDEYEEMKNIAYKDADDFAKLAKDYFPAETDNRPYLDSILSDIKSDSHTRVYSEEPGNRIKYSLLKTDLFTSPYQLRDTMLVCEGNWWQFISRSGTDTVFDEIVAAIELYSGNSRRTLFAYTLLIIMLATLLGQIVLSSVNVVASLLSPIVSLVSGIIIVILVASFTSVFNFRFDTIEEHKVIILFYYIILPLGLFWVLRRGFTKKSPTLVHLFAIYLFHYSTLLLAGVTFLIIDPNNISKPYEVITWITKWSIPIFMITQWMFLRRYNYLYSLPR